MDTLPCYDIYTFYTLPQIIKLQGFPQHKIPDMLSSLFERRFKFLEINRVPRGLVGSPPPKPEIKLLEKIHVMSEGSIFCNIISQSYIQIQILYLIVIKKSFWSIHE